MITDVTSVEERGAGLSTPAAEAALVRIRVALARHGRSGDADALQDGLEAARDLIAAFGPGVGARPEVVRLRGLAVACPEFGALLDAAAAAAADALAAATDRIWLALGLSGPSVRWTGAEREAARMVFACACAAPTGEDSGAWLTGSLRRLAAARIASRLSEELCRGERIWLRVLSDRYGSLRHRCAPRTALRSRGLSDLLRDDDACRLAVAERVERWVNGGAWIDELAVELEAAVVHARTPARLA